MSGEEKDMPAEFPLLMGEAFAKYGPEAVMFFCQTFMQSLMPVAVLITQIKGVTDYAEQLKITHAEMMDGMALIAMLKDSAKDHDAWNAATLIRKHTRDWAKLNIALMSTEKKNA